MARNRDGTRTVQLLIPIVVQGRKLEEIHFRPFRLQHTLDWEAGEIPGVMALMSIIAELSEQTLQQLIYPDVDNVINEFMYHLPAELRAAINSGNIPAPNAGALERREREQVEAVSREAMQAHLAGLDPSVDPQVQAALQPSGRIRMEDLMTHVPEAPVGGQDMDLSDDGPNRRNPT